MKILLIEDDKALALSLASSLRRSGLLVDLAHTAKDGRLLACEEAHDLIIIDLFLPDGDGGSLLADIRQHGLATPIIIISGSNETACKIRTLEQGADDYIAKPFEFPELLARIKAIGRRPPVIAPDKYKFGAVEVDFNRWLVLRHGKRIRMTNKELSLLRFFLDHKNVLLSRNAILEHVWDMNADPFSNTIETHIMKLRKNLGDKRHEFIETVPGQGYILRYPE